MPNDKASILSSGMGRSTVSGGQPKIFPPVQGTASLDGNAASVTVSVVSHGHGALVSSLLGDLAAHCGPSVEVVLTLNVPEATAFHESAWPFALRLLRNEVPAGFGANHNAAFRQCTTPYFCVLNPDIHLAADPFPRLVEALRNPAVGVAAPCILDPAGNVEDSARRFPTPGIILRKALGMNAGLDYAIGEEALSPDWVAGMFMVLRSDVFREVSGFDERYFLYYEDVDLCRRLRRRGYDVRLVPAVRATHDARRESHHSVRHLRWHVASMLRFLLARQRC